MMLAPKFPLASYIKTNKIVDEGCAGLKAADEKGKRKGKINWCGSVTLSNRMPLLLPSPRGDGAMFECHTLPSYNSPHIVNSEVLERESTNHVEDAYPKRHSLVEENVLSGSRLSCDGYDLRFDDRTVL